MRVNVANRRLFRSLPGLACVLWLEQTPVTQGAETPGTRITNAVILSIENKVEVARRGAGEAWDQASVKPPYHLLRAGDRLRTGLDSRALLRLSNLTDFPIGELTQVEIPVEQRERAVIKLLRGLLYFFHRDRPGEFQVDTPTVSAVVRGTECVVEVAEDGTSTFRLIDGALEMSNGLGRLELRRGEEGVARPGQAPARTAVLAARLARTVQWSLYYPGVLHVDELSLSADEQRALAESLAAYRLGDLLAALARYPAGRQPVSDSENIFRAALLLSVGKVTESDRLLDAVTTAGHRSLARAIQTVVTAVTLDATRSTGDAITLTNSPTAWLAESYWQQSQFHLEAARTAARRAVELAPNFSFAWTQLAELEFGFGRTRPALEALETSLRLAPRNAQALALQGFLLAARNRITEAVRFFDEAILADGALGNAWLGRGLCRIRQGRADEGRADLQVAATLEPQRAVLRSYLGKAFSLAGNDARARHELELARELDANDPTSWLYSALIQQQQNRINESIHDLETSEALNDNRRIYRSRLLLDQDRAVRGANLASIYEDANMTDVSLREAARAVNADYANYSAHLFLANTYNALRDPRQFNLRYETPWFSEYLVANLLAPAAAGTLSPYVTQQEYGRLFERDRLGVSSATEYRSSGDWVQNAVQYGVFGNSSYAVEVAYRSENGSRPNNDLEELTTTVKLKQQVTLQDSVFFQGTWFKGESGDLAQYYSQTNAQSDLRFKENQEPLVLAGWHHEWSPGAHTLLFGGHWHDVLRVTDPAAAVLFLRRGNGGVVNGVPSPDLPTATNSYRREFDGFTTEIQQIFRAPKNSLVFGARYQAGTFDTRDDLSSSTSTAFADGSTVGMVMFAAPAQSTNVSTDFQRLSFYAYDYWQIAEPLLLTAGLSYDELRFPINFRISPVAGGGDTTDQLSPKAGLIWSPATQTTLRAAYSQSLGGVSFDQSFQLEPTQVAGFNQAFRSLIPESVAARPSGAKFENANLSLEQKLGRGTYLGAQAEWAESEAKQTLGAINLVGLFPNSYTVSGVRQRLDYEERSLVLTFNQLLGDNWSLGVRYRLSDADLESRIVDIPTSVGPGAHQNLSATLHQVNLFALFNHESGFFSQFDSIWSQQSNRGYSPDRPGDDFWQFNLAAGYRFWKRRMEAKLALLNLNDRDYHLNPLNLTTDLPRERTLVVSFRVNF